MLTGRLGGLLLALLVSSACRPPEPGRLRSAVRLIEHAAPGAAAMVGGECAPGGERRPAFGCTAWGLRRATSATAPDALGRVATIFVPTWEIGRPLFVRTGWRAAAPGAPLQELGAPRVQPVAGVAVQIPTPELRRAALPPGAQVELWTRPAPGDVVETTPVTVGRGAVLDVGLALDPTLPVPEVEAVEMVVVADAGGGPRELLRRTLRPSDPASGRWTDVRVVLDPVAGPATRFTFQTVVQARAGADPARAVAAPLWGAPQVLIPAGRDDAPDLVLVSLDTLRADHVGVYGGTGAPGTPRLDALAAEGAVFEQAVTTYASTTASHASLMTGLYPVRHGVRWPGQALGTTVTTLAEQLAAHGWRTGAVTEDGALAASAGFPRGFASYREIQVPEAAGVVSHVPEVTIDAAIAWLGRHVDERVFLFVHTYAVHWPYVAPDAYRRPFVPAAGTGASGDGARFAELRHDYGAEVRYADAQVARLLDAVARRPGGERSVVVVTADHGEEFGEHGLWGHSRTVYDEILRVPLLVRAPGLIPAGRRIGTPTSLVDVMPTLLDLLGVPVPPGLDGESLAGRLRGETPDDRERVVFAEVVPRQEPRDRLVAARTATAKWIRTESTPPRLAAYDLTRDPGEREPLDDAVTLARGAALLARYEAPAAGGADVPPAAAAVDDATTEKLRALGYLQ